MYHYLTAAQLIIEVLFSPILITHFMAVEQWFPKHG